MRTPSRRLASIDVFRAITMFLMIFVNDLPLVTGVPSWLEHAAENEDRLGFADTIFPAFLFIVGLSIPLAIRRSLSKGGNSLHDSVASNRYWSKARRDTLLHIILRSLALLVMGFYQVNYEEYLSQGATLSKFTWLLIITIAFFFVWLDYPAAWSRTRKNALRAVGILTLGIMAFLYRGGTPEEPTGMEPHWYGILGLIGWSYLLGALIYFFVGDRKGGLWAAFLFFLGFLIADLVGWLDVLDPIRDYVWIIGSGSMPAIVMAGVVCSVYYGQWTEKGTAVRGLWWLSGCAVLLLALGFALRPLGGISKVNATPAWVLICTAISMGVFALLAFIADIRGRQKWYRLLLPAGTSTLTCYLLPYIHFSLYKLFFESHRLPVFLRTGAAGIGKSLVFAFLIVLLTGVLEKRKVRLCM